MDIVQLDAVGVSDAIVQASPEQPLSAQLSSELGGTFDKGEGVREAALKAIRSALEGE